MGQTEKNNSAKNIQQERQAVLRALSKNASTGGKKGAQSPRSFWLKTIPFFAFIAIVGFVFIVYEGLFYISAWKKGATKIAQIVHFPVAFVSKDAITINQLETEKEILEIYSNNAAKTEKTIGVLPDQYEQTALTKLIRDSVLNDAAKKYGIRISDEDLENAFKALFGTGSASLDGNRLAQEASGLSAKQFKKTILYDALLQQKISVKLESDEELLQQKKKKAQTFSDAVRQNPALFDEYLSTNPDGLVVRDIGFRNVKTISPTFAGLKDMQVGSISSLIESEVGFHVMRLAGVIPDGSTGDAIEFIHLEEMLVAKPSFTEWIRLELSSRRIVVLNPQLSWSSLCDRVIAKNQACTSAYENLQKNKLEDQIQRLIQEN